MLFKTLALSALVVAPTAAQILAGYSAATDVTDHAVIDLDQKAIQDLMSGGDFVGAKAVYNSGGHSKSFASVIVDALPAFIAKGTKLEGTDRAGEKIQGIALDDHAAGALILNFQYDNDGRSKCDIGGLPLAEQEILGCLMDTGSVFVANSGSQSEITYVYDYLLGNNNGRTIAQFSTGAKKKMHDCDKCPYVTYEKFVDYYDEYDYGNQWIAAAFDKRETEFPRGNGDFSNYDDTGRSEIIQKGTAYLNVWMYVIREMEDALDDCIKGDLERNDNSVHAWDEAVAFYVGSLEGNDGAGAGTLLYSLADKRCKNFKTCGEAGNMVGGTSAVNIKIRRAFEAGKNDILSGQCDAARGRKEEIEKLMAVPMIQGTLRYSFFRDYELGTGSDRDKIDAEGAVFAAAVLPLVYACDGPDAKLIYDNMRAGLYDSDFPKVKAAFEANYACMGVTCADVGGLYSVDIANYFDLAAPCGGESSSNTAAIVGGVLGGLCGVLILIIAYLKCGRGGGSSGKDASFSSGTPAPPPTAFMVDSGSETAADADVNAML